MGKATRWLRSLLGSSSKKPSSPVTTKDKKKLLPSSNSNSNWTHTTKFSDNSDRTPAGTTWSSDDPSPFIESLDANKHAIAVAAATAAVAEAALAAAQAAAEVVRLTSVGGSTRPVSSASASASASAVGGTTSVTRGRPRELAAVKIQSAFRAYLARRALRALKGLVKLQALVRGRIVRKQSADMLRRMQAMARIQARACAGRVPILGSANSQVQTSKFSRVGSSTSKGCDIRQGIYGSKHAEPNLKRGGLKSSISNNNINIEKMHLDSTWLERWMEESAWNSHQMETFKNGHLDDGNSDKILEIDTWKPRHGHRQSNKTFQAPQYFPGWKEQGQGTTTVFDPMSGLSAKFPKPNPSISSEEITSLNFPSQEDQQLPWAPDYSPRVHSATSRPGSSSRRGPFTPTKSECSRSLFGDYTAHPNYMANTESSLAKLRSQSAPRQRMQTEKLTGRKFVHGLWDMDTRSEKGSTPHTQLRSNDRLEMPVHGDTIGYNRIAYESRR